MIGGRRRLGLRDVGSGLDCVGLLRCCVGRLGILGLRGSEGEEVSLLEGEGSLLSLCSRPRSWLRVAWWFQEGGEWVFL